MHMRESFSIERDPGPPFTRRHLTMMIGATALLGASPITSRASTALPAALRTVNVSNQSQFGAALANAVAGDHIVLANGSYSGLGKWTKSGSQQNPIVVRSANLLGARLTSSIDPNGSDLIFHGLDFVNATVNIGIDSTSNRVKVWRCRWRDRPAPSTSIALRTYRCNDLDIAYCEWTNWAGRAISFGVAAGTRRPHVRRCLFRNTPVGFFDNATEAVQVGFGRADRPLDCEALIELCRFTGWNSDDEVVSVKSSGNTLRQLTFDDNEGRCGNRMGRFNQYQAIWFKGPNGIRIHDKGNLVLGCDFAQAGQGLRIATGNHDAETEMTMNNHPNAIDTHVAGCSGSITIGHAFPGHAIRARHTTVRQHSGPVYLVSDAHIDTLSHPEQIDVLYSWPFPVRLDDADVGPHADLA